MKINIVNHSLISYRQKGITNINVESLKAASSGGDNVFDDVL